MKSKKLKNPKTGTRKKRAIPSDVCPSTSLPPLVEGQLRCFLRVTVSRLLWTLAKPPSAALVRLHWWGEPTTGTLFRPRHGARAEQRAQKTTARFAIRCGPKQFTSYLTDMGSLVLEVLTKSDQLPIGRVHVAGINRLSMSHPISGYYTLVSPSSEKLGELQVSLVLEPLTDAYDSSSSGPTTDLSCDLIPDSSDVDQPAHAAVPGRRVPYAPRRKDDVYFEEGGLSPRQSCSTKTVTKEDEGNVIPIGNKRHSGEEVVKKSTLLPTSKRHHTDILSVLLDRGSKLRNAMTLSAMKSNLESTPILKEVPVPVPKDNIGTSAPPIDVHMPAAVLHSKPSLPLCSAHQEEPAADVENRAIELLLGSVDASGPQLWDAEGFPEDLSVSHSSVCMDSELGDPLYDQSLLEQLFYRDPTTESAPAEEEEGDLKKKSVKLKSETPKRRGQSDSSVRPQADTQTSLSSVQATLLGKIRLAKVVIHSLTVPEGGVSTSHKDSSQGRPPRPTPTRKCTYFVEYGFPVATASYDDSVTIATELTRMASCKVAKGEVCFEQENVFPVRFKSAMIDYWWSSALIFSILSRKGIQKKPVPIGRASFDLRPVLQCERLCQTLALPVLGLEDRLERNGGNVGSLKVTLELSADGQGVPSPNPSPDLDTHRDDTGAPQLTPKPFHAPAISNALLAQQPVQVEQELLLHVLLMVPDGRDFSCGPGPLPNVYLSCKLLGADECTRSAVSWGQMHPTFNFIQVAPVALSWELLERMKNNVMVIEVWQKRRALAQDRPLGLVKLPLHQFYMSFRDPKISQLLLQAQYPVVGVDGYVPVTDPFSGCAQGRLRVLLAVGMAEQIASLQRIRTEELSSVKPPLRPLHLLDSRPDPNTQMEEKHTEVREHVFAVHVEKVKGLMPLQSTVWGEADCYVQYSFPTQAQESSQNILPPESELTLKQFRTATTLCVPDPVFSHTENHVLTAPVGMPIQRLLLGSFTSQGHESRRGVLFEVWCRYYYPNVRDQLVAKGLLPLSKLCAMVTMQHEEQSGPQMFSLPLVPNTDSTAVPQPSGLIDVSVHYKHRPITAEDIRGVAARFVVLTVQIHRAAGLKAAALAVARFDDSFQYYADMGLNSYITVELSFLPEGEKRSTRVTARSFCPEYEHHAEFPCSLMSRNAHGAVCSLAELLETGAALFTVYNRESRRRMDTSATKDTTLGTVSVKLSDLLLKSTGICGWFPISCHSDSPQSPYSLVVGGLELSVSFAHHSDRERVMDAARGLGWEKHSIHAHDEDDDDDEDDEGAHPMSVMISVPRVWIPLHCLQLPGQRELQRSTYCYYRLRLCDSEAYCSPLQHPCLQEEAQGTPVATATMGNSRTFCLNNTSQLQWYLREERLEVQVWVAFGKHKRPRPHDTDRLVGSAYVDLSSLAQMSRSKRTLTGVYPLFRPSVPDLSGAAIRLHVTLTHTRDTRQPPENAEQERESEEELLGNTEDQKESDGRQTKASASPEIPPVTVREVDTDNTFRVTVTVERAMHLSLKGSPLAERSGALPCCCVSYSTADASSPVSTPVAQDSECPVWNHQQECRLSKKILMDPQQSLVFKIWHKGDVERVLGFASVDLSLLLAGFHAVSGWYNITDFGGQCQGQLKVSISPLENVKQLRAEKQAAVAGEGVKETAAVPFCYQTTAVYRSFPSHISRYTEQQISTSPDHSFSGSICDRREEPVTQHASHQTQQEQRDVPPSTTTGDAHPSSSMLFTALRKNLSELDDIQKYFSHKLSTPPYSNPLEKEQLSRDGESRESEGGTAQLLLRSNLLVGEVNGLIRGLSGNVTQVTIGDPTEHAQVEDYSQPPAGSQTQFDHTPHKVLECLEDDASSTSSFTPEHEADEVLIKDHEILLNAEEEALEEQVKDKPPYYEEELSVEEEDEEYEETIIEPRMLNEVTSWTDKTSPWTSLLSEPDLDHDQQPAKDNTLGSEQSEEDSVQSYTEGQQVDQVADRAEDADVLGVGEQPETEVTTIKQIGNRGEDSEDDTPCASQEVIDVLKSSKSEASCSYQAVETVDPVEIPDFFLPPHHLEASMRALRLAAVFPSTSVPTGQEAARRSTRPRPNTSAMKKEETMRIAKIFASRFAEKM